MNIRLVELKILAKRSIEVVPIAPSVTFIHGPVGTGKSTVARLIDYCLGGELERTPALQQEFVAAELSAAMGKFSVRLERGAQDRGHVRVTWTAPDAEAESTNAPLEAGPSPIHGDEIFNLSDLIFALSGSAPIKVRKSKMDPESPLVRLSFRDLMWYCYLEQDHLDSSFFRLEDPFKRLKSRDAMRFVTGLHSERMNELEIELVKALDEQRAKREAVQQIRAFMARFQLGSEIDLAAQRNAVEADLAIATARRDALEQSRTSQTHAAEPLREQLRQLSSEIDGARVAFADVEERIGQQEALRAELVTAKIKAGRAEQAGRILAGVEFGQCPRCGADLTARVSLPGYCALCLSPGEMLGSDKPLELEALRRDLNERIDELSDSLARHRRQRGKQERVVGELIARKRALDDQLGRELAQYDSAYVSSVRAVDRDVARLQERLASLERLRELPQAISDLEEEAGRLQGRIDVLRASLADERARLTSADARVGRIAQRFLQIMQAVGFPGVYEGDRVFLDPRSWLPFVQHGDQEWTFRDAGSGGKKTLFNVCYALAVHSLAAEEDLPLPSFLIIDSPTKNISEDENPDLVRALYRQIYSLAAQQGRGLQLLLIDSDLVPPEVELAGYLQQRMAGEAGAPRLFSYYEGP